MQFNLCFNNDSNSLKRNLKTIINTKGVPALSQVRQGCFFVLVLLLTLRAAFPRFARNPVRIPRSKIGKLAFQTQSVGIFAFSEYLEKHPEGVASIKQVLISLRDPNGVAVRPSGFDCVRPCHSERSGAESNCEAAPSKAKVESRADSAQDDTQGATPSEK